MMIGKKDSLRKKAADNQVLSPARTPQENPNPSFLCVGKVLAPHGVRGQVKIKSFTQDPAELFSFSSLFVTESSSSVPVQFEKIIPQNQDVFLANIQGISCRTHAESLKGAMIFIHSTLLKNRNDLEENSFYHRDLLGLQLLNEENDVCGVVSGVHNFGAGDLLEISVHQKSFFLPFIAEAVPEVNLNAGYVRATKPYLTAYKPEDCL